MTPVTQEVLVKELVRHRQHLPTIERNAGTTYVVEAASGRSLTYGELGARVLRLAHALRTQLGVSPGDRVAVMSLDSGAFLELDHAGLLGAAVVNPLDLRFAPRELPHVLADSGMQAHVHRRHDRPAQGAPDGRAVRRAAAAVGGDGGARARAAGAVLGGPGAGGALTDEWAGRARPRSPCPGGAA